MDINTIVCLLVLGAIAAYVWGAQGAKEIAHRAAKAYCSKVDVQFLDDSVVIRGLGLQRNAQGRLCLKRCYDFEFASTGERRYHGSIILLGRRIANIELQVYRVEDEPVQRTLH